MSASLPALAVGILACSAAAGALFGEEVPLESFEKEPLPANMILHNTEARIVPHGQGSALEVRFHVVDWPNVFFRAPDGVWDWSACQGIAVDLYNPSDAGVNVAMRVDNEGADGMDHCMTASGTVLARSALTLRAAFAHEGLERFWGMRGVPILGPVTQGSKVDPSRIVAFQVFLPLPSEERTLLIDRIYLYGRLEKPLDELVSFPFVDPYGQYKHADWPGKLHQDEDFAERRAAEQADIAAHPVPADLDEYGGWLSGPRLEASGWFRTHEANGVWWLVTPAGHLFFSTGMDCVGTWEATFVEKRDDWFEELPGEGDPLAQFYGHQKGAHSGAAPINGEGRTYSFYRANLLRKYGESWPDQWRESAYARLRSWGFNTIANWSQEDVLMNSPVPFVASAGIHGQVRRIESGGGYWSPLIDVYDPAFASAAERSIEPVARKYSANPLCIGFYVDNELSWEGARKGVLTAPPDQPCRIALIDQLREQYGAIERLNEAWGTAAADWENIVTPAKPTEAFERDLDSFEYAFAKRYFETVRDVLRAHAPNHLYLGCRFSTAPRHVVRAAGDVCDVVSFNRYEETIQCERWTGENDLGKPLIIGEFHFGALDRGMFHTGLVGAVDQADRARKYRRYVESVLDCPAFVGCHWFQYIDEPITGRWFDGENYNIGFVTVTDTPYPEMVAAAREAHTAMYERRMPK